MALSTTTASAEATVRGFVAEFSTPNTREALRLCESGRLTWEAVAGLFARSLAAGVAAVK